MNGREGAVFASVRNGNFSATIELRSFENAFFHLLQHWHQTIRLGTVTGEYLPMSLSCGENLPPLQRCADDLANATVGVK